MKIVEQFLAAKNGLQQTCEDRIHVSDRFVAVIDGATSKVDLRMGNQTLGALAAQRLDAVFSRLPARSTAAQAVRIATEDFHEFYRSSGMFQHVKAHPACRLTASFVAYSAARREVWAVGDCQFLLDRRGFTFEKKIDRLLAEARSLALELELIRGATMAELQRRDVGREFILPLLERQTHCQNNPSAGEFYYSVIDGFPVSPKAIAAIPVPSPARQLVLASDGYPSLRPTLRASEARLRALLKADPLLFRRFKSTKGLRAGADSFDDRAYVRLRLD